jgi:uncharacterized membrane protein YhfC
MDIIARILNFTLMIAMPLALGVLLAKRLKAEWSLFGIGTLTFIISQVFHIPFNIWALSPAMESSGLAEAQSGVELVLFALAYGLSAGVFEEITRYLGYRFWLKDARSWKSALMFGAGHGGIEAILLGGLTFYAFLQAVSLRNADLSGVVAPENIELSRMQLEAYWSAPWYAALLGAVERAATLCFHVSASVLVLQAFTRRNPLWLGLAIGWHTLVDAIAVFSIRTWNVYISLRGEPVEPETPAEPPALVDIQTLPTETSTEDLEDSRYV